MNTIARPKPRSKRISASPWLESFRAGKAGNCISSIDDLIPDTRVVLWCRVSERTQDHNANLDDQVRFLQLEVEKRGGIVIAAYRYVGSGVHQSSQLYKAVACAREHGAVLIAETTDRFVRPYSYHCNLSPNDQATEQDLKELSSFTEGVQLMTFLVPDAQPEEVRSFQRKRGQRMKDRKGGRPKNKPKGYLKKQREEFQPEALRLRSEGRSYGAISKQLGIPRSTIQRWVQGSVAGCTIFSGCN